MCNKGISFLSPICPCMISLIDLKRKIYKKSREKENAKRIKLLLHDCKRNSLSDSHFQTNVIDDVENLLDYSLYITYFVLCTHNSCTNYMQIFPKFCTYDWVLSNLTIFNFI